jgi:predicted nucleotidyltransferase
MLTGSLSAGGVRPGRSDIDLLAVVDGRMADAQAAVVERLARQADVGGAAGIDLDVVTAEMGPPR